MSKPNDFTFIGVRDKPHAAIFVLEEKTTSDVMLKLPEDWDMRRQKIEWTQRDMRCVWAAYAILWVMTKDKDFCDTHSGQYAVQVLCEQKAEGFELEGEDVQRWINKRKADDLAGLGPMMPRFYGDMTIR